MEIRVSYSRSRSHIECNTFSSFEIGMFELSYSYGSSTRHLYEAQMNMLCSEALKQLYENQHLA